MARTDRDPRRRCMPLAEWPEADRAAWEVAIHAAGPLDNPGLAAHWRPKSRRYVIDAYGRYLTFLAVNGWLVPEEPVADRLALDRLRPYIDEIRVQVSPATAAGRIRGLAEAVRVMAPGVEFPHLKRARYRLKALAVPSRDKRSRIVSSHKLAELGLKLMRQAETGAYFRAAGRACTYRDGLIILLMAARPLRRGNFGAITLERHLTKVNAAYQLAFERDEMKNGRPYTTSVDPKISPFIDRYLEHYRPILLRSGESARLWIAMGGGEIAYDSIYGIIATRTRVEFGWSLSPHLFRDCAVTSLGAENPELVWVGMSLLDHTDPRTTEKHYDQALTDNAVAKFQDSIRQQRRLAVRKRRPQTGALSNRSA